MTHPHPSPTSSEYLQLSKTDAAQYKENTGKHHAFPYISRDNTIHGISRSCLFLLLKLGLK